MRHIPCVRQHQMRFHAASVGEDWEQRPHHELCEALTPGVWLRRPRRVPTAALAVAYPVRAPRHTPWTPVGGAASSRLSLSYAILLFLLDLQPFAPSVRLRADETVLRPSPPQAPLRAKPRLARPDNETQTRAGTELGGWGCPTPASHVLCTLAVPILCHRKGCR